MYGLEKSLARIVGEGIYAYSSDFRGVGLIILSYHELE